MQYLRSPAAFVDAYRLQYLYIFIGQSNETEMDEKGEMEDTRLQEHSNELRQELPFETMGIPEGRMYDKNQLNGCNFC